MIICRISLYTGQCAATTLCNVLLGATRSHISTEFVFVHRTSKHPLRTNSGMKLFPDTLKLLISW